MGSRQKQYGVLTYEQEKLVKDNVGLAYSVAHTMYNHYLSNIDKIPMTRDDFIGTACLCLCIAVKNYDAEKGAAFSTYLTETIKKGVLKYISRKSSLFVLPSKVRDKKFYMADGGDVVSFDQPIYEGKDGDAITVEETLASYDGNAKLFELMYAIDQTLSGQEKHIFLSSKLGGKSQVDLAKELGVSQMTVSRTLRKATEKLKKSLVA